VTEGGLAELIEQGKQHVSQFASQIRAVNTAACAAVQYRHSCWPTPPDPVKEVAHEATVRTAAAGLSVDVVWFVCQRVQVDEEALQRTLAKLAAASSGTEQSGWRPYRVTAAWVRGQWEDLFLGMAKRMDEMPGRFLVAHWTDDGQPFHLCSHASNCLVTRHCSWLPLSSRSRDCFCYWLTELIQTLCTPSQLRSTFPHPIDLGSSHPSQLCDLTTPVDMALHGMYGTRSMLVRVTITVSPWQS
jgi:hypothetical protein